MGYKAIIIGVGNLGFRHLQGLCKSKYPFHIDIFDILPENLFRAQKWFSENPIKDKNLNLLKQIPKSRDYDLAIIATSSKPRLKVSRDLLNNNNVKYIIFEKVLFPSLEDYAVMDSLLSSTETKAWVNCPYRLYPHWRKLKDLFCGPLDIMICGGSWGLGSNAIHMADLAEWLSGEEISVWDGGDLCKNGIPGKREGYLEFFGILKAQSSAGTRLEMRSLANHAPLAGISLMNANIRADVFQSAGQMLIYKKETGWRCENEDISIPYQSDLTGPLADEIISAETCLLPEYGQSSRLHQGMIRAFLDNVSPDSLSWNEGGARSLYIT